MVLLSVRLVGVASVARTPLGVATWLLLIGSMCVGGAIFVAGGFAVFRFQTRNWSMMTPSDTVQESYRKIAQYRAWRARWVPTFLKVTGAVGLVILAVGGVMKVT